LNIFLEVVNSEILPLFPGVMVGFGASIDIEPDVDEANYLKTWFAAHGHTVNATRPQKDIGEDGSTFATLAEIRLEAGQSGVDENARFVVHGHTYTSK
jgi:hypothetical protein